MNYSKYVTSLIFLLGLLALVQTTLVFATSDDHYEEIIENTNYLNSGLKYELQTNIANGWNSTSQLEEHAIKTILDSVNQFESTEEEKHSALDKSLQELRALLIQTFTISDILDYQYKIKKIENALRVLHHAEQVSETLKYYPVLNSKTYLHNVWDPIQKKILQSKTIDDIMIFEEDIQIMEKIINYNNQIHENTHSPVFTLVIPHIGAVWDSFRGEMTGAESITEMTSIATRYHNQIGKVDENLIAKWEEKIVLLEEHAKQQGNHEDLVRIEQNIKNLNMVKKIEKNANPFDNDMQSKAILYNLSQNYLVIKSDLKQFDLYLENKNQFEQKITNLQSKANNPQTIEKMPEFESKIKNTLQHVSHISSALKSNDFQYVQQMIKAVEREWTNFERFYPEIRNYKPLYQQPDISTAEKKQIYFDEIETMNALIENLNINHTSSEYKKYQKLVRESKASIIYGNFDLGHKKIYDAIDHASTNFLMHDPRIIMNVIHDDNSNLITVDGAVYKHSMNSRGKVFFYLYDKDNIVETSAYTTKHGEFQILLGNKIESGIYLAQIQHGSANESQIISIQDNALQNIVFSQTELSVMELANTFERLENFLTKFEESVSENQLEKIHLIIEKIKLELGDGKVKDAAESIQKFKNMIKLYVPVGLPELVIDASITDNTIRITGKTSKLLEYPEPIFLTVFDQDGKRVFEQMTYDDKYGNINIETPKHAFKGLLLIQVEYHDFLARDTVEVESKS